jgi:hypothetical protein
MANVEAGAERRRHLDLRRQADRLRARPPRPPTPTRALERELARNARHVAARERMEGRSMVRGLVLLALMALLAGIARAGLDRVFVHGWWNQW